MELGDIDWQEVHTEQYAKRGLSIQQIAKSLDTCPKLVGQEFYSLPDRYFRGGYANLENLKSNCRISLFWFGYLCGKVSNDTAHQRVEITEKIENLQRISLIKALLSIPKQATTIDGGKRARLSITNEELSSYLEEHGVFEGNKDLQMKEKGKPPKYEVNYFSHLSKEEWIPALLGYFMARGRFYGAGNGQIQFVGPLLFLEKIVEYLSVCHGFQEVKVVRASNLHKCWQVLYRSLGDVTRFCITLKHYKFRSDPLFADPHEAISNYLEKTSSLWQSPPRPL